MASDALIVSIAEYPMAGGLLRPLPGATVDSKRVSRWLRAQTPDVQLQELLWPAPGMVAWNRYRLDELMRTFVALGMQGTRDRLLVYMSGHGRSTVEHPAMPAVYCAQHSRALSDLFAPAGWIRPLIAAPLYREYLFFFDCCNDLEPGQVPQPPSLELRYRDDTPSVLVVAACAPNQQAVETDRGGVFTDVLLEGLSGSAGGNGAEVTALDLVGYLKEHVPIRAALLDPGRVQTPKEWFDPGTHGDLAHFRLFRRQRVSVDVSGIVGDRVRDEVEILNTDLERIGTVAAGAGGKAELRDVFPGKYILRATTEGWRQLVQVRTRVDAQGTTSALAEALETA